ncbi:MAG: class I adenylate-forming enzyme family protein, partial [Polaromonas sp.]|nr:class I adenylate-forming enzyme family protein [Polaromonas sp.]
MSLRSFTLHDLINRNARLYGSKTALVFGDQRVTHAQYAERTARLAAGLAAAGVGPGDRLAILAPNGLEYVDLFGAAAHLGAIVVPINWRLSAEEVAYVIEDVAPRVLIVADEFKALVPQDGMAGTLRYTLGAAQAPWQAVSELYLERDTPAPDLPGVADDSGLLIIHTAAVGGRPRGALLSHRNLLAASLQTQLAWHLTAADVNLGVLPLFHVAAIGFMLATQQAGGATLL